ncbi:MAG: PhoH family protein [Pyrinomonadaceae bacterium MAG19_C2-C3]|nr:PhoH family protein [Pyrinomonadaceae bacterium MAG19_C2-C3]
MKKIELPPRGIETLFGVHDQNIKYLEALLAVTIDARGQDLTIDGDPKDVAVVERILDDFASLFAEGRTFTDRELREAFAQIAEDRAYSLRDYFTKARFNPSGKKLVAPKTAMQRRYIEAMQNKEMVFGVGPAGTGKCIAGDSLVITNEGMIDIASLGRDLKEDEYKAIDLTIHGVDGAEAASHVYRGGESETLKISTRFGFEIEATPEHPLLSIDESGNLAWKRADRIQTGDTVALQRGQRMFGDKLAVKFNDTERSTHDHSSKPVRLDRVDEDFAYMMGVLTGDGCLTFRNRVLLASADDEIVDKFKRFAARFDLHVFPNGENNYVIASSQLYRLLAHLGMSTGKAATKCIPDLILHAPERIVSAFMRGLFDADGTIEKRDGLVSLNSISENLIKQTQIVLLNFGIVTGRSIKRGTYKNEPHTSHLLTIAGAEAERFHELIGFNLTRKRERRLVAARFNVNVDLLPYTSAHLNNAVRDVVLSRAEHKLFWDYRTNRRRPSYTKFAQLTDVLEMHGAKENLVSPLRDLLTRNLLFLEIKSIKPSRAEVFDLTVPETHSFIANGFVNHNSYLAVAMAVQALTQKQVDRIVLVRPAVEAGERLGFLPGDLQEKIDPYLRPLYDALFDLMDAERVTKLIEKRIIEVAPLAFMRGRTLGNAFVILDEAQNTTSEQMKMFLTRIGFGSRAVITGDMTQIDLPTGRRSGLIEAERILAKIPDIEFVYFTEKDVVRHRLVQLIVRAYEEASKSGGM